MRLPREVRRALSALDQHEEASARRLLALLAEARLELRARLATVDPESYSAAVLTALEASVAQATQDLRARLLTALLGANREAQALGSALGTATLPSLPSLGVVVHHLPEETLSALERYQASLITALTDDLRGSIQRQITLSMLSGQSLAELSKSLGLLGVKPIGPFKTARQRCDLIARTETNRVANLATLQRYREAAQSVPGLKKQWLSAKDSRVRPSHQAADGQTVGVDEQFTVGGIACDCPLDPALPARETCHCRCRSVAVVPEET